LAVALRPRRRDRRIFQANTRTPRFACLKSALAGAGIPDSRGDASSAGDSSHYDAIKSYQDGRTIDDVNASMRLNGTLQQAQAVAAQLGWNGFTTNLSESQQLYYGKTAADILALQAQGIAMSRQWQQVLSEVPGVIVDSNGNMAGDSADLARIKFLIGAGAIEGVTVGVADTLARIARGESFPHRNDGAVFQNREGLLPRQAPGYYREYVVQRRGIQALELNES
jgi:hypothetical protein